MWPVSSKGNEPGLPSISNQRFGLKQQQFSVLNEIVWLGPLTQKELGETLLFEKSNVSKIVKLLFEKKWIRVEAATHDRRLTLLNSSGT